MLIIKQLESLGFGECKYDIILIYSMIYQGFHMSFLKKLTVMFLLALSLVACGGGGSSNGDTASVSGSST